MKALTGHGKRDIRVEDVPDPTVQDPSDADVELAGAVKIVLNP